MLDGIDDIDWTRLGHAYGSAEDVPGLLRALLSPDEQARTQAFHELYGNIYHQGTRYEATAYAVPFLLEMLADPGTPDRPGIAELLCAIAIGYDSFWLPGTVPIAQHREEAEGGEALLAAVPIPTGDDEDGEDGEPGGGPGDEPGGEPGGEDDEEEVEYGFEQLSEEDHGRLYAYVAVRAYDAVRAGVPLLLDLLADPDPALQTMAAYTLAWFPEEAAVILPRLMSSRFDNEVVQATALVSIGLLGGRPDPLLLNDSRPLVRWGAAIALPDRDGLVSWVTREADRAEAEIPFLENDLGGLAGLVLGRLDPQAAFEALLARIPLVSGSRALPAVSEALRLAFAQDSFSGVRDAASLTPKQRRLAQALADSPGTWLYSGRTFGNLSLMLTEYGLPRDCERMREFLNG